METILLPTVVSSWGAYHAIRDKSKIKQDNRTVQTVPEGNIKVPPGNPRVKIATQERTATRVANANAMIVHQDTFNLMYVGRVARRVKKEGTNFKQEERNACTVHLVDIQIHGDSRFAKSAQQGFTVPRPVQKVIPRVTVALSVIIKPGPEK